MSLEEIAALPVPELADPNGCHLYLWVTHHFLPKWSVSQITVGFPTLGFWRTLRGLGLDRSAVVAKGVRPCGVLHRPPDPPCPLRSWNRRTTSFTRGRFATSSGHVPDWSCSSITHCWCPILPLQRAWLGTPTPCGAGVDAGPTATLCWKTSRDGALSPVVPPLDHAGVQAIACEVVYETARPVSRQALADLAARACRALGTPISRRTVWRRLHADARKPWR